MSVTSKAEGIRKNPLDSERLLWLLIALLFLERLALILYIGVDEVSSGDDVAYIRGGICFARTGIISVWEDAPTALIMPGMPIVTGLISRLCGEGTLYLGTVKVLWSLMGAFTALYLYRAARLYLPGRWALFAAAALLMPNRAWMDTIISTETPYTLFFLANFYYMLRLRSEPELPCLLRYTLSFLLALFFRANILVMPLFALVWVLTGRKCGVKKFAKGALIFCALCLVFFVPWTIRNYRIFDAFIPVSYGMGNPTLKGSYQGSTAPTDEELDYETNVDAIARQRYARYFDENGDYLNDSCMQYVSAMTDRLRADYRMRTWFSRDPVGFLRAYLIEKPMCMLTWVYYWGPDQPIILPLTNFLSKVNFVLCAVGAALSLLMKQKRGFVLLLCAVYWVNLYLIACSYAIERYAALLMPFRYMLGAVGLYLLFRLPAFAVRRKAAAGAKT